MVRKWSQFIKILAPSVHEKVLIRLLNRGCANRQFYQIGVVPEARWRKDLPAREVIGSWDPMPNERGEKLVALNLDRFYHWIGQGASCDPNLAEVLGLAGVMPIPPSVYQKSWQARLPKEEESEAKKNESS